MTRGSAFMAAKGARSDSRQGRRVRRGVVRMRSASAVMAIYATPWYARQSKMKHGPSSSTYAAGRHGAVAADVHGGGLALGAQLSGAGYGDVAEQGRAIVSCNFGARDSGFSGDSALAAGGKDAV